MARRRTGVQNRSGLDRRQVAGYLRRVMIRPLVLTLGAAAVMVAAGGCDDGPAPDAETAAPDTTASSPEPADVRHERAFAFTTLDGDSAVVVPFLFAARSDAGAVRRRIEGWIERDGEWERFVERTRSGPEGAPPWRILPDGPVRLVVGEGDAVERIAFADPPRRLELTLLSALVEWPGPEGQTYRLDEATLLVGDDEISGVALDLARSWTAGQAPGDWAFLVSGDSLQVVLDAPGADAAVDDAAGDGTASARVRLDFRNLQWPELEVTWTEERAYDPARRNVPAAWSVTSETGEVEGEIQARSAALSVGEGEGPVLPVRGLFGVEGIVEVEGAEYPVRGFVRHRQE